MKKKQLAALSEQLFKYFHEKYGATRTEIDEAIREFGYVKPRINTYFLVRAHEKKKPPVKE
jgi:hypothetical protein